MQGKEYPDEFKRRVVDSCNKAKEMGYKVGDILREYGVTSGSLASWRKKFREETSCPAEVFQEFGVDPNEETEPNSIKVNDEHRRESVIVALVMSGYTVWQTEQYGDFFIHFEN